MTKIKETKARVLLVYLILGVQIFGFQSAPASTAGVVAKAEPMHIARFGHTATLLSNGQVLVVGGSDENNLGFSSAELYDPQTGKWSETGNMNEGRCYHTATLLPNGQVLVVGGLKFLGRFLDKALASAELYDPHTGKWTNAATMKIERLNHTATLLSDGKVLIAGGSEYDGNICTVSTAEIYDATTGMWSETGEMTTTRSSHTATLMKNGKVLVVGGKNSQATVDSLSSAEIYDPVSGIWTEAAPLLITGRCDHTTTLLNDGRVLVTGGWFGAGNISSYAELFNPATGKWERTQSMNFSRSGHAATMLPDEKVLVSGGGVKSAKREMPTTEIYDPAIGKWTISAQMSNRRINHTATLLNDGSVLFAGGYFGRAFYSTVDVFRYQANEGKKQIANP